MEVGGCSIMVQVLQKRDCSEQIAEEGCKDATNKGPALEHNGEAANAADNIGGVSENADPFFPEFTEDNISIQVRLRAEQMENFTRDAKNAINEAFVKRSGAHQNVVFEVSGCKKTDIEALKEVRRELGIKGKSTVDYTEGVYRIVIPGKVNELVIGFCMGLVTKLTTMSTEVILTLQYLANPLKKQPDASFCPSLNEILHRILREVVNDLPEMPVFEMAYTEAST
ncbi:hypothetical protein TRICI_005289 [Trichomonascus ciferrii]|uniref:Uncharacterized protein n=1 Tax=Trichomonascus ciferrii TaxID=44093 RepID=A0A642UU16_9ASCO|nr:hypothetical protein TRICI_005289 [Trichomonascus ciferrii]